MGAEGFDDNESSALADTSWVGFSLGGILALVTGIVAWLLGRRRGRSGDVQAGKIAVGWFVLAVLIVVVVEARRIAKVGGAGLEPANSCL